MAAFLENNLCEAIELAGAWSFKLGEGRRRTIDVPSAWEASQRDSVTEGPALYRRAFHLDDTAGAWLLECDAISFAATVRVNDQPAGEHTGLWSRFQIDISPFVRAGKNTLEIEVWKPGDSRFKLRESLAGFLPDVCNTFGGIWQGIRLRRLHGPALAHVRVETDAGGRLRVEGKVDEWPHPRPFPAGTDKERQNARAVVSLNDEQWVAEVDAQGHFALDTHANAYAIWSPAQPHLHDLTISLMNGHDDLVAQTRRRVGFRDIAAHGNRTVLNAQPIHLRGVLDWGWDEKSLRPALPRDEVIARFKQAQALGFNLWKLCLYVPDETLFDRADEMGMLLWLELPMWLPKVTPALRALAQREYDALLQRVHHHPSIVVVSLGCEMDAEVDGELLRKLGAIGRRWLPNALRTDNSGSSEAYGGAAEAGGDFHDYHFYTDPHFFQPLIDHFRRPAQPDKPWIFGEFCDADTQRDWTATRKRKPFWLSEPVTFQRAELDDARNHQALLRKAGVRDGAKALSETGKRQADCIRKYILEQTRHNFACGGYVVTSWRDTPIATSSLVDDAGALKVDPALWPQFNAERVLLLDRERRRAWTHGGDRPVHRDPFTWFDDEPMALHLSLANGVAAIDDALLECTIRAGGEVLSQETKRVSVDAGGVSELSVKNLAGFTPALRAGLRGLEPIPLHVDARLMQDKAQLARNTWMLWRVPRVNTDEIEIHNALDDKLLRRVSKGQHAFVWLRDDAPFTRRMPFWREAIHVFTPAFERIAGMGRLPHADLRFFGVATDLAIDTAILKSQLMPWQPRLTPLWRRFDARRMVWHDYAVQLRIGQGHLIASTLRFAGGLGHQPATMATNPMGAWLLGRLASFG
jgi:hypothetical protein